MRPYAYGVECTYVRGEWSRWMRAVRRNRHRKKGGTGHNRQTEPTCKFTETVASRLSRFTIKYKAEMKVSLFSLLLKWMWSGGMWVASKWTSIKQEDVDAHRKPTT